MKKTKLTPRAQAILDCSIVEYEKASGREKEKRIAHVEGQLHIHERGLKVLGIGPDADMVEAGKEFLKKVK